MTRRPSANSRTLSSSVKRTSRIYRTEIARIETQVRKHQLNMSLENLRLRSSKNLSFAKSFSEALVPIFSETSYTAVFRSPHRKRAEPTEAHCRDIKSIRKPIDFEKKVKHIMHRFDTVKERLDKFHISNLKMKQVLVQIPSSLASLEQSFDRN
mmetsp:Transcript_26671/g.48021  ORF Transcript_26671/g.48021 Transcript_26671/m.48021 type:complete len:154 (+) Transcript_26671:107-568(+)